MADINWVYYSKLKKEFMREKGLDLEELGYSMACGLNRLEGKVTIEVRIQPLPGSPDPIDDGLLEKIKNEVLRDNYKGVSLDIHYIGMISARDTE